MAPSSTAGEEATKLEMPAGGRVPKASEGASKKPMQIQGTLGLSTTPFAPTPFRHSIIWGLQVDLVVVIKPKKTSPMSKGQCTSRFIWERHGGAVLLLAYFSIK